MKEVIVISSIISIGVSISLIAAMIKGLDKKSLWLIIPAIIVSLLYFAISLYFILTGVMSFL